MSHPTPEPHEHPVEHPVEPPASELLIVDDLMLLLMDDDGASVQGAGTLYYTLAGALLTELGLLGRVEAEGTNPITGPRLTAAGTGPLPDPLLQWAYDAVAEKPRRVQTLLATLGPDLSSTVIDRLADRGLLDREESRFLGVFRTTKWVAPADEQHEAALRARIRAVLVDGEEPDARTAALIALLSASGSLPTLRPPLPWTSQTAARAYALQSGEWGAEAVSAAVVRTAASIAASSISVAITAR